MRTRGGRPVEHFFAPVVPNARYTVTCTCGYATDSDAVDEYAAVGEVCEPGKLNQSEQHLVVERRRQAKFV